MAFSGVDAVRILSRISASNESIQREFLVRNRVLNRIRSDLYLSGTYLRDYLLESDPAAAERHRKRLETSRLEMDGLLAHYATLVDNEEQQPLSVLQHELALYWRTAAPALDWSSEERRLHAYPFLQAEVFPRRSAMVAIADGIDAINEKQLTAGGARVSSLFTEFRQRLTITLGVTFGLGLVLAAFSFRRVLHLENQEAARKAELKDLSARIVETQENERRALSRELHDAVGQTLSALMLGISNLGANLPAPVSEELKASLETTRHLASTSVSLVRNISLALRPSMLDDLGLVPALRWQAREVSRTTGMQVEVSAAEELDELADPVKTCLYRVVQEALRNCTRHSAAQHVTIAMERKPNLLEVSVRDDGRGFVPATEKGLGLLGMHERVAALGGEFQVTSEPGAGTLLRATLPLT